MVNPDDTPQDSDERKEGEPSPTKKPTSDNNSAGKEQGDSARIVPTSDVDSAPMVPLKPTPDRAVVSIIENPSVLEALVHEAPAEVLKFVETSDDRQFKYFMQREENRHKERMAREATTRIAIAVISGAAIAGFAYSAFTGNEMLSSIIVTAVISAFSGLGIKELLKLKEED